MPQISLLWLKSNGLGFMILQGIKFVTPIQRHNGLDKKFYNRGMGYIRKQELDFLIPGVEGLEIGKKLKRCY